MATDKPVCGNLDFWIPDDVLKQWIARHWPIDAKQIKANAKRETWRVTYDQRDLLVKWYRLPQQTPWVWLKSHNPAAHVTRISRQFAQSEIRTVAIGGCEAQCSPIKSALLVMEWLPNADILHNFAHAPDLEKRMESGLLDDIMRQMVRMHQLGWVHGDLKWGNILIREQQAWFIDLDGVHRKRPGRNGYRDLARFMVDCDEAQSSEKLKQLAIELYARHAGQPVERIQSQMAKDYRKIHNRHQQRYDGSRNMPQWPTDKP